MRKVTLQETDAAIDYRGLTVNYAGDGLKITVTIFVPEGEDANVETRNQAKAEAIRKAKAFLGENAEVQVEL